MVMCDSPIDIMLREAGKAVGKRKFSQGHPQGQDQDQHMNTVLIQKPPKVPS